MVKVSEKSKEGKEGGGRTAEGIIGRGVV